MRNEMHFNMSQGAPLAGDMMKVNKIGIHLKLPIFSDEAL